MTGVYQIKNTISGNFYIGSSGTDVINRIRHHKRDLNKGSHHCQPLQRAWLKYGKAAFLFDILMVTPKDQAVAVEQLYIDWLSPKYNTCKIAGSVLGIKRDKAYGKAISDRMKGNTIWMGRTHTEETKAKIAKANKGRMPHTHGKKRNPETVEKIRLKVTGQKRTEEQKARMVAASRHGPSWNKGLKMSEIHIEKNRQAKLKYNYVLKNLLTNECIELQNINQFCKMNGLFTTNIIQVRKNGEWAKHKGYQIVSRESIK